MGIWRRIGRQVLGFPRRIRKSGASPVPEVPMLTTRAVGQRLLPILIVGGVLALSILARPLAFNATAVSCSYGYLGAPTVTGVAPSSGTTSGGDAVTISGCGFTGATTVKFGNAVAPINSNTDSTITTTSPPHAAGTVDVTVTTPSGTSATS